MHHITPKDTSHYISQHSTSFFCTTPLHFTPNTISHHHISSHHFTHHISHHIPHHTIASHYMPCDHITPVIHHSTYSTTPPHYMPHCISHHTSFHTTPPHLTLHHYIWHHTITHHTGYALNCILHVTIPHHHIALSHIAHHSCVSHHTTSYYAFELHHSASCAIPHHSAVYSTSRHTTLFPYCIITPHSTTQHIAPPHLVAQHSTPHLHILHYTYCSTSHHIWHHTLHLIPHHSPFHITTYCTLQLHYISRSHMAPHFLITTLHYTSFNISSHFISTQFCTISNITQLHHKCHYTLHHCTSSNAHHSYILHITQMHSTSHHHMHGNMHRTTTSHHTTFPITNTSTSHTPTSPCFILHQHTSPCTTTFHKATLHHHILLHNIPQQTTTFGNTFIISYHTNIPHHTTWHHKVTHHS